MVVFYIIMEKPKRQEVYPPCNQGTSSNDRGPVFGPYLQKKGGGSSKKKALPFVQ